MSKLTTLKKAAGTISKAGARAEAKAGVRATATKKAVASKATAVKRKLAPYSMKVGGKDWAGEYYGTLRKNGKIVGKKSDFTSRENLMTGNYGEAKDYARRVVSDTNMRHRRKTLGMQIKPKAPPAGVRKKK